MVIVIGKRIDSVFEIVESGFISPQRSDFRLKLGLQSSQLLILKVQLTNLTLEFTYPHISNVKTRMLSRELS